MVDKLVAEFKAITEQPAVNQRMLQLGLIPQKASSVEEMRKFMASEDKRWGDIIRKSGIAGTL